MAQFWGTQLGPPLHPLGVGPPSWDPHWHHLHKDLLILISKCGSGGCLAGWGPGWVHPAGTAHLGGWVAGWLGAGTNVLGAGLVGNVKIM